MAIKDWKCIYSESARSEYKSGHYVLIIDGRSVIIGDERFPDALDQPEIIKECDTVEEAEQFADKYMKQN